MKYVLVYLIFLWSALVAFATFAAPMPINIFFGAVFPIGPIFAWVVWTEWD